MEEFPEEFESRNTNISVIVECSNGNHDHAWNLPELVEDNKNLNLENQKLRETKGYLKS